MTIKEIAEKLEFNIVTNNEGLNREVKSVYCCDLLSFAMGKAPADGAWITVMGNINVIAVASLADVSCVILAEGVNLDEGALKKANEQDIAVLSADLPAFECGRRVFDLIGRI